MFVWSVADLRFSSLTGREAIFLLKVSIVSACFAIDERSICASCSWNVVSPDISELCICNKNDDPCRSGFDQRILCQKEATVLGIFLNLILAPSVKGCSK